MALSLSEFILRDFAFDRVDSTLIEFGAGNVVFPAVSQAYFHLVLSGTARLKLEEPSDAIELPAGHFAILFYGAAHSLGRAERRYWPTVAHTLGQWEERDEPTLLRLNGHPCDLRVLSGCATLTHSLRSSPSTRALPHVLTLEPFFTDLSTIEEACRGPGSSAFVFRLAQILSGQVLRNVNYDFRKMMSSLHLGRTEMGRIAAIVRKMREHPEKRWTVASLAAEMGCSRSSFAAKFHAYTGMGPIRFAARTRLLYAQSLLKSDPGLPLWEVAKRVGYDAQGSFTRAFKEHFGISPRGYVRELQKKSASTTAASIGPHPRGTLTTHDARTSH